MTTAIVVDASALIVLLARSPLAPRIDAIWAACSSAHAPHLLDAEVLQGLRRLSLAGALTATRAAEAMDDLTDLRIERHGHLALVRRAWELRNSVSAYDALYVTLAEHLDAPLITCDGALARAHGHAARVELVA